ncbi:DUF4142 domain-containing protein [Chitinophaga vietnamensis]|uniref:DUF4142 domain-containing protein n=1 Tax=Chitinophaga vietnamensis TaxID=2593957 RepID=UPI0011773742|nr:DUF4142 domain-containing protein [Chitinophaga vietnamensis]
MKNRISLTAGCLGLLLTISCGNAPKRHEATDSAQKINEVVKPVDEKSSGFAVEAANGGMMEVAMGTLAQEKAQNKRVKDFGIMMVNDHSKANDELKELAGHKGITLPASVDPAEQKHIDELSKKTGKDFDKAYIDMMVDDHNKDVKAFEDAAGNLPDMDVKAFASKTLPVLKVHQDSAKAIKEALKKMK